MRLAAIGDNCVDFYEKQGWAYPGGNAVNVAVYGRQLGMDAAYLGWIGTDNFGDMMQEKLKEQDVETVHMQRKQGKTAITYIELLDGDRKFGEDFLNVLEGFQLSDGDLQYLAGFDCVHMAVWGQCDSCLGKLPQEVKISYDFSNRYGEKKIERLAPYIDYVVHAGDNMDFKKESVHAMVEKIVADAQTAYSMGPNKYVKTSENFGRVDKGACLGLISFVRWVAATPLWNGASQYGYNLRRVFENEYAYDATRWRKAKEAAKAVLDFEVGGTKRYSLYTKHDANDFKDPADGNLNDSRVYARLWDMFYDMDAFANEYVFFMTKSKDQAWQGDIYPPSREGSSRQQPVQEQVDEYEYIVGDYGYPVYSAEARKGGYDDTNPYVKGTRDPRFYRDVIYHGAPYRNNKNESKTINTASGSDKIGATNATTTGYYLRKFQQESWNKSGNFSINAPAIWRLPEFIYIYAEACNELGEDIDEAYKLVNTVRERSFMKPMPPEVKTNQQLMREYIQRERRVELFYEGKRPWTCRLYLEPTSKEELAKESLWKSSGSDNSKRTQKYWAANNGALPRCQRMINGMRPVQDENGAITVDGVKYRMERFCVEERTFSIQHYLFPIRQSELQKTPTIEQNPGW